MADWLLLAPPTWLSCTVAKQQQEEAVTPALIRSMVERNLNTTHATVDG